VLTHEALIIRDSNAALHVKTGVDGRNAAGMSFFLEPYSDVMEMQWSGYRPPPNNNDDLQLPEIEIVKVIDMRARKIFFRYQVRTRDNVKLNIDGTIFWQVKDIAKMISTTSDPQGDVWHHARSSLISIIAKRSLQDFMSKSNDMISEALQEEKSSTFYADRGVEFQHMELTRFDCSDAITSDILQQVVVETTNKINRLTAQDSVNEVRAEALKMDIELEKLRTLYIWNKTHNDRLEAQMSGESVGVELARSTDTFIKGLEDLVPEVDKRINLFMMHKELKARNNDTENLVSGNAQLFITPKDLKLRVDMTSNSNDPDAAPRALTSDDDEL
jgi:regulator of protease activity HflC (stomatin/prohibitin superfamily)